MTGRRDQSLPDTYAELEARRAEERRDLRLLFALVAIVAASWLVTLAVVASWIVGVMP